jgi:putative intracellular protease/amidase
MKFGFDIDGTISAAPAEYRAIMLALRAAEHEVHVITGQGGVVTPESEDGRRAQLAGLGIFPECYDVLYLAGPSEGSWDWQHVAESKAAYCRDHGIAFMFEDSPEYAQAIRATDTVVVVMA